jgi:hypothetical protein
MTKTNSDRIDKQMSRTAPMAAVAVEDQQNERTFDPCSLSIRVASWNHPDTTTTVVVVVVAAADVAVDDDP